MATQKPIRAIAPIRVGELEAVIAIYRREFEHDWQRAFRETVTVAVPTPLQVSGWKLAQAKG